jgi:flagellar basal body L-ring protein FlgH
MGAVLLSATLLLFTSGCGEREQPTPVRPEHPKAAPPEQPKTSEHPKGTPPEQPKTSEHPEHPK